MPLTFLTLKERENYQDTTFPVEEVTIRQYFHLGEKDLGFIAIYHGQLNRLAVAVQMGTVRYLGYLPTLWQTETDIAIIHFVAKGLKIDPLMVRLGDYGKRDKTRTKHLQQILKHLNFRKWQPLIDEPTFEKWLIERGMGHENERYLLDSLCQKLHQERVYRPAIGTLESIVGGIRELLELETYQRLAVLWTKEMFGKLDQLLEVDNQSKTIPNGLTVHRWLCNSPVANTPREINQALAKLRFLKEIGSNTWDLSSIPENRKKRLAGMVRNDSNNHLKRLRSGKLYPMLICFLRESFLDITDSVLIMYSDYWQHMNNKAKKALGAYQLNKAKSQKQAVYILTQIGKMVADETIEGQVLRGVIFQKIPKDQLKEALELMSEKKSLKTDSHLSFLRNFYATMKQFTPDLLEEIHFKVAFTKDNFETALNLVTDLHTGRKRKIPQDAPMNFVSRSWEKIIIQDGKIDHQNYELCVLSVLRNRLQSGDVFVDLSRKHTNLESLFISKIDWGNQQEDISKELNLPNLCRRIDEKVDRLTQLLPKLSSHLLHATDIRLEKDKLVITALSAEDLPSSAKILQRQINERLPKVSLVDMIQEVDMWLNYSIELEGENTARNTQHPNLKYAALFSNACNLSLADLARSSDLDYQSLWWVANNYFSDENLKKANNILVNYHHKQWISSHWGGGTLSSSDGQRFPTSGKIRNAKALPKYFGYGKGISIYTHTADQYSQFGSNVVCVTERDATYVLNEILANETDLPLVEHTTDTHGYSDLNFALFDLVGKQYSPRIRDLKDQRLYKISGTQTETYQEHILVYPPLKFTGNVNIGYLKKYANEMTRVAASLKMGTVTSSTLIKKLQAYPKQNNLMYVLQSYGQLNKTIFICRYLLERPLRRKINAQLNKGEQLHGLRLYLWFGGDGIIRKKQENEQQVTAQSLNLLTNIVLVWNTVYIQEVVKQLRSEGITIDETDLQHISPSPFEHINRLGKYSFKNEIELDTNGLRPLRKG
jgi:TnpA family transposase